MLVLCISTTTMAVGFAIRIPEHSNPYSLGLYIIMTMLTLLSPCGFLAQNYVILPRLASHLEAEDCLFLSSRKIVRIFVWSDVATFWLQAAGGGMTASQGDSMRNIGHWVTWNGLSEAKLIFLDRLGRPYRPGRQLWPLHNLDHYLRLQAVSPSTARRPSLTFAANLGTPTDGPDPAGALVGPKTGASCTSQFSGLASASSCARGTVLPSTHKATMASYERLRSISTRWTACRSSSPSRCGPLSGPRRTSGRTWQSGRSGAWTAQGPPRACLSSRLRTAWLDVLVD